MLDRRHYYWDTTTGWLAGTPAWCVNNARNLMCKLRVFGCQSKLQDLMR